MQFGKLLLYPSCLCWVTFSRGWLSLGLEYSLYKFILIRRLLALVDLPPQPSYSFSKNIICKNTLRKNVVSHERRNFVPERHYLFVCFFATLICGVDFRLNGASCWRWQMRVKICRINRRDFTKCTFNDITMSGKGFLERIYFRPDFVLFFRVFFF